VINWHDFISQCFNGLVLGALLALIASGLTIIYGMLGVLNLAHGAMFMLGGYGGWVAYAYSGSFIAAVIAGSFCRNEPAAELRGLANTCPPISAWRLLRARKACLVM